MNSSIWISVLLASFAAYLAAYAAYQMLLVAANALITDVSSQSPRLLRRFVVLVPAHNEELYLPRLLASLTSQEYPADHRTILVIADNCGDGTASAAQACGVDVLARTVPELRGKGHAIGWALERIDLNAFDGIVVVDGDSVVAPDFLHHLNLQMDRGDDVIQCYNGVANPGQTWFTRMMHISRTIANEVLHPGKRKLGLSSHLMGNGMCFSTGTIRRWGWHAFTVGEDWEYYARLVLAGGYVGYSVRARVYHQESVSLQQASGQRLRWAGGRFEVLRRYGPSLLVQGVATGSVRCLDAALPLVFPNPSLGINLTLIGWLASAAVWMSTDNAALVWTYSVIALVQLSILVIGVLHTQDRLASALSLFMAPVFLGWKLGIDLLSLTGAGTKQWRATVRKLP